MSTASAPRLKPRAPIDLETFLDPDLTLTWRGHTYKVTPPTTETALTMTAIVLFGAEMDSEQGEAEPESDESRVRAYLETYVSKHSDTSLAKIALTERVLQQMVEDEMPKTHIDKYALYSLYFWTLGRESADSVFEFNADGGSLGEPNPKVPQRSKNGPSTEWESPMRTGSTPDTKFRES